MLRQKKHKILRKSFGKFKKQLGESVERSFAKFKLDLTKYAAIGLIGLSSVFLSSRTLARPIPVNPPVAEQVQTYSDNMDYGISGNFYGNESGSNIDASALWKDQDLLHKYVNHKLSLSLLGYVGGMRMFNFMYWDTGLKLDLDYTWSFSPKDKLNLYLTASGMLTNLYDKLYMGHFGALSLTHTFSKDVRLKIGTSGSAGISFPNFNLVDFDAYAGLSLRLYRVFMEYWMDIFMTADSPTKAIDIMDYKPHVGTQHFNVLVNASHGFIVPTGFEYDPVLGYSAFGGIGYSQCFGNICVSTSGVGGARWDGEFTPNPVPFLSIKFSARFNRSDSTNYSNNGSSTSNSTGVPYMNPMSEEFTTEYSAYPAGLPNSTELKPNGEISDVSSLIKNNGTLDDFVQSLKGKKLSNEQNILYLSAFAQLLENRGYSNDTLNDLLHGHFTSSNVKKTAGASMEDIYEAIREAIITGTSKNIAVCGGIHGLVASMASRLGMEGYALTNSSKWGLHVVSLVHDPTTNTFYLVNYGSVIKTTGSNSLDKLLDVYGRNQGSIPQLSMYLFRYNKNGKVDKVMKYNSEKYYIVKSALHLQDDTFGDYLIRSMVDDWSK